MTPTPRTGTCTVRARLPYPNLPPAPHAGACAHGGPVMQPAAEAPAATLPAHRSGGAQPRPHVRTLR